MKGAIHDDAVTSVRKMMDNDMATQPEQTLQSVQTSHYETRNQRTKVAGIQAQMDRPEEPIKAKKAGNTSKMWMVVGAGLGISLCAMIAALVIVAMMFGG